MTIYGITPSYTFQAIDIHVVTLTVTDAAGNTGTDTIEIDTCDCTPPVILVVAPGESLTGVPVDWELIIVFNEPMNTASVEEMFSISGGATVSSFTWDTTGRYVTIVLAGLACDTQYTFTIGTNASDMYSNCLVEEHSSAFTTVAAAETGDLDTNFMADNWWLLVVIIIVLAVLLLVQMVRSGSKPPEPAPEEAPYDEAPPEPEPEGEGAPEPEPEAPVDEPAPEAAPEVSEEEVTLIKLKIERSGRYKQRNRVIYVSLANP